MKKRILCCGDIHGQLKALKQALERANFDKENDTLISLGDVVDRGPDSHGVVDFLLSIPNLIAIKGNHDDWFLEFLENKQASYSWVSQGGFQTLKSYAVSLGFEIEHKLSGISSNMKISDIPQKHLDFFHRQQLYYIDDEERCFLHAGFNRTKPFDVLESLYSDDFYWNRVFWKDAIEHKNKKLDYPILEGFKEIFIGHTPTLLYNETTPMHAFNIINLDTGAGKSGGKLTVMDVNTKEFWQSDTIKLII